MKSILSTDRPLEGKALHIVQIGWVMLALLSVTVFIASIPPYFHHHARILSRMERAVLQKFGFSVKLHAIYAVAVDTTTMLVFSLTAIKLFKEKPRNRMVVFVSIALLMFGVAISPSLDVMSTIPTPWQAPALIVLTLGIGSFLFVLFLFPDGRFVPRWTRTLALVWTGWLLSWILFPSATFHPDNLSLPLRLVSFLFSSHGDTLQRAYHYLRQFSFLLVLIGWFGSGVFAQVYRYMRFSGPVERQQTKWVVFGSIAAFVGYFGYQTLAAVIPAFHRPGLPRLLFHIIGSPISAFLLALMPLSITVSMLHYRLWDIDPIIENTLLYSTLTGAVAILYFGDVYLVQRIFRTITGQQSDAAIIISTLVIAAIFRPLRRRLQGFIDRSFYRERIDFRRAFTNFSREIRTIIELPKLLHVLVERTTELLHVKHGAVYLRNDDGAFVCSAVRNLPLSECPDLALSSSALGQLHQGEAASPVKENHFSLLVPLTAPRKEKSELVGLLALGPRLSGQRYSREDRTLLTSLTDQAGTAIHVARLIQEKQAEAQRREEVERRLEAHRNSPLGRAEAFANTLLAEPRATLSELHQLVQAAGQDPEAASLIDHLPSVLDSLGAETIEHLAEGFNYLYTAQVEPEVLPVGLRTLTSTLEEAPVDGYRHADEALTIYRLCQAAMDAGSIPQITQLLPDLKQQEARAQTDGSGPFEALRHGLSELHQVADALHAYERVEASQDKLAYLVSAVERLRRVDYLARTELGSADRPVIQQITEHWLAVVTGALGELQTSAKLACRLLTRHTWQEDVVPLVLSLRNEGRGAALNLQIKLVPAPSYDVLDEVAHIEQIAPGEEARVELRVRPRLPDGESRFRARFIISYTDPRGPDQVENFADVVRLLSIEGEYQFIPNPYVVGTPLEAGSPLFFGREDVVTFIQQNMEAQHRNNLVLIGQRRTGKTSLLKQLPVRLGDDYLPVYLDGQALGLDPGLPNFFLALATEITFALEDRGFEIDYPEYEDFVDSPSAAFERDFLSRVQEAIDHRHLLIMFDEFEELESAVQRGNLEPSIFGFLRHLIQHTPELSVIFCGTHRLEELASDYWNVLFNISLYRHIALLDKPEAMHLIQDPVSDYNMRYDDLALDKIWQVTAGHPYFLQLLCHSLVNRHNKTERNYVTVADVNAALDEIMASGEAHFVYLWAAATPEERLVLTVLSRMIPLTGRATTVQVVDYLTERGVSPEQRVVSDALHQMALRDILYEGSGADPAFGEVYRWKLGLLGLWVKKYRSMSRVIEEARAANPPER